MHIYNTSNYYYYDDHYLYNITLHIYMYELMYTCLHIRGFRSLSARGLPLGEHVRPEQ